VAQIIPVTNDAAQSFRTVLGGQTVRIRLVWSDALERWTLEVVGILRASTVHSGLPIFSNVLTSFVGEIAAIPLTTPEQEPGRNAWGSTHLLVYNG